MGQRRKAREIAVQTLYALDFAEVSQEFAEYSLLNQYPEVLQQLTNSEGIEASSPLYAFADELVKNAIINLEEIEQEIDKHTENWSFESLAHLDRSIMHIAVYELMFTDTPAPVVINEAIEISKKFCSENTGKFLNGILDAINKEIKDDFHPERPS
ncbi:MAG: transcription antitermination factor NusB [Candidatus Cloacimonetes bacterium]|nr:transcription antitermination factor NusB [Candidatus Cloacimonadota bacterium]HNZ06732.1 transcription antitermination factor NusB [Candidatus Cloacimonadota bacterium]HOH78628.1 transcription antitermination factor NusB [Candidatus Cloacimonadota bacterium]